jgi:hypothetical protein
MSTFKGPKSKCRFLSAIAHTQEAMGGDQYGFCIGVAEDVERCGFHICSGGQVF